MANELHEATIHGNVELLLKLIQEDPLILDRNIVTSFEETPLHVAAMLGHDQFCIELLRLKPELAREVDCRGSSPLYLASANRHLGIVKTLLSIDPDMCFVRDSDGRNPYQVAAKKGRVNVLKELLQAKPDAGRALVNGEGTILHLCVEFCQFEALKLLMENVDFQESINCKDSNGNTILHLAVAEKQIQTIDYLLNHTRVEVNAVNAYGLTALDILLQSRRDKKDMIIAERLQNHGVMKGESNLQTTQRQALPNSSLPLFTSNNQSPNLANGKQDQMSLEQYLEKHDDWIERQREALMLVASLIASMGFTAGVTPPSGVLSVQHDLRAWTAYSRFLIYNTISFMSSISIILLLVSGVPFKRRMFMWILMVIVWVAVASTACTYGVSIVHHLEHAGLPVQYDLMAFGFWAWLLVMLIIVAFHTNRIYLMLKRKFKNPSRVYESQIGVGAVSVVHQLDH